jgi:glycosyltransferase involved in cell wall biosynthesis
MPQAMNALDCLVHPQVGTEAFGMVLLEAFACGKPVIASALDGIPEAFHAGGIGELVPPGGVPELAAAMRTWAVRPALTEREKDELHRRIAARFSREVCAKNVLSLYHELLA